MWQNVRDQLSRLASAVLTAVYGSVKNIPAVSRRVDQEVDGLMAEVAGSLRPYRDEVETVRTLPARGRDRAEVLAEMERLRDREQDRWRDGFVSGAVYHGDRQHVDFLDRVYAVHSQCNPLHSDLWPSISKYEAEIVSMTADMLGAGEHGICGTVSSGGTESILLAMKTYRDHARERRGIRRPQIVAPVTAHAAFDKAARYFGIELVKIPVDDDFRADVGAARRAIGRDTVAVVGSAPSFPHGVIDPIEELSARSWKLRRAWGRHRPAAAQGTVVLQIEVLPDSKLSAKTRSSTLLKNQLKPVLKNTLALVMATSSALRNVPPVWQTANPVWLLSKAKTTSQELVSPA